VNQSLRFELALRLERLKPREFREDGGAWLRDRLNRRRYRTLDERELLATRTSDTAFVFGSGRSVLEITPDEWERIAGCNTVTFSEFHRQSFVRADYHMVGEVADEPGQDHVRGLAEYAGRLRENPLYARTVLFLQEGWLARSSNELVGYRLLRPDARLFRYRRANRGVAAPPTRSFRNGLTHGWNSSISATNIALLLGFRRIVLAGVDLYDRGYFWLAPGERRDNLPSDDAVAESFPTADGVVELFGHWRALLEPEGVELAVYNPRSLLAETLPVFAWSQARV
jgi:hypothetical protein